MSATGGNSFRALVVCIGNGLVADDAAGCEVYGLLCRKPVRGDTRIELTGIAGIDLLDWLQGEQLLIVVDAVRFGSPPGTIHVLPWEEIPTAGGVPVSAHGIGIREAVEIGRLLHRKLMPEKVMLVGIEGSCFDVIGGSMTPEVRSSLPEAAGEVLRLIDKAQSELRRA